MEEYVGQGFNEFKFCSLENLEIRYFTICVYV